MTKIKNKKHTISIREKSMEKLVTAYRKLTRKVKTIQDQILDEIQKDSVFNNLTSYNQSYNF